jgi:competence ComEA-like helix-hairpin-helix protein
MRLRGLVALAGLFGPLQYAEDRDERLVDKATYEIVCGSCHAPNMDTDLRSESEWIETIDQMRSIGAKGTDKQFDRVLRYLARNFTKIDVNTATAAQIAPILDIDAASAQGVVKYRAEHGNFRTLEDLKKVPGMAQVKLDERKERIIF